MRNVKRQRVRQSADADIERLDQSVQVRKVDLVIDAEVVFQRMLQRRKNLRLVKRNILFMRQTAYPLRKFFQLIAVVGGLPLAVQISPDGAGAHPDFLRKAGRSDLQSFKIGGQGFTEAHFMLSLSSDETSIVTKLFRNVNGCFGTKHLSKAVYMLYF